MIDSARWTTYTTAPVPSGCTPHKAPVNVPHTPDPDRSQSGEPSAVNRNLANRATSTALIAWIRMLTT